MLKIVVRLFSIILLISSCKTIPLNVFESYNNSVITSLNILEQNILFIETLGENSFSAEATIGLQEISTIRLKRTNPYVILYDEEPFYLTIRNVLNRIKEFNDFYKNYSNALFSIASNNLNISKVITSYNYSLIGISEDLGIDNDIIENSIITSSLIFNLALDRFSYNKRLTYLKEISNPTLILEILEIYINIIDELEFTIYDYYSRTFFALEMMGNSREINEELIQLNNTYELLNKELMSLRNSFIALVDLENQLKEIITEENFNRKDIINFVTDNYILYEELND